MACIILSLNSTIAFLARPDKSTEYGDLSMYGTGIGLLFYASILCYLFFSSSFEKTGFTQLLLAFYVSTYYLFPYSGRILAAGMTLMMCDLTTGLRGKAEGIAIYSLIICFNMLTFNGFMSQF